MPVGTITDRYRAQIEALKATAAAAERAALTGAGRLWHVPDDNGGAWDGEPHDIAGVAEAFDRSEVGGLYSEALNTDQGSVGDAMALKVQSDYLAAQERAWRMRHLSPVRAALHAAARRAGHADGEGKGVLDRVTQYAADLLMAGAAGWVPPEE